MEVAMRGGGGGLAPRPSVHSRPLGLECVSERLRAPSTQLDELSLLPEALD